MFSKCIPFWNMAIFNFGRVNMTGGRSLQPSPMLVFHWRRIWSSTTFASPMATWRRSFDKFQEGKGKILLSQWHTFDTYLVGNLGNTKLKVLYRDAFGWVSNIYTTHTYMIYIYIYTNIVFVEATKPPMKLFRFWQRAERCQHNYQLAGICSLAGCF